jgi:phage head maturation protease
MGEIASFPMQVESGSVTEDVLAKINKHTRKALTAEEVFVFSGVVSDDTKDSYDTRMDPETTLRNYADDLASGVPLMSGHDTSKQPFGRSFDSEYNGKGVTGHFYLLRNCSANGQATNDIIRNIEGGIIRDMSVGFAAKPENYICSVDGRTIRESRYYPGDKTEDGEEVFYWIKNARLREVSTVYKGSNGNAYIEKVREAVDSGQMDEKQLNSLEERFQTRFDSDEKPFYFAKKQERGAEKMTIDEVKKAVSAGDITLAELKRLVDMLDKDKGGDDAAKKETGRMVRALFTENDINEDFLKALKANAEAGRAYKEDLISEAVKNRVAIQGDGFDAEQYRGFLANADLGYIKSESKTWADLKQGKYTAGRQTEAEKDSEKHAYKI